jgi:hypothetical protein
LDRRPPQWVKSGGLPPASEWLLHPNERTFQETRDSDKGQPFCIIHQPHRRPLPAAIVGGDPRSARTIAAITPASFKRPIATVL